MGITPLAFTGISKYSDDFQTILSRSVKIASLPAQLLESQQKELQEENAALEELRGAISGLAASLQELGDLRSGGALRGSSSSGAVQVTLDSSPEAGTYQISGITSLASSAIATAQAGLATPGGDAVSSGDHLLELVVGGTSYSLQLTAETDNLAGVRDAINSLGAGVTASILDTGAGESRYYLSVAAVGTGETQIELRTEAGNGGSNLLEMTNAGSNAVFQVNGRAVTSPENLVSGVIPGVTLEIKQKTGAGETVTVSVGEDRSAVVAALEGFVSAYNALSAKLSAHLGEGAGVLAGDNVVVDISQRLREMAGFRGAGSMKSLADLGITVDRAGVMSLDSTAVQWMAASRLNDVFDLLGDPAAGLGRLADGLYEWSDPLAGLIRKRLQSNGLADSRLASQIEAINERVSTMQASMMARLQAADSLLAHLESQQGMLTATLDSLTALTNGKKE